MNERHTATDTDASSVGIDYMYLKVSCACVHPAAAGRRCHRQTGDSPRGGMH